MVHDGHTLISEESKVMAAYDFFDGLMGTPTTQVNSINLEELDLPRLELNELGNRFTEEEVWNMIRILPSDKVLGSDDFTAYFLQTAWHIIRPYLIMVFDTFWSLDTRSFHSLN
jgi:hypothetical protein